MRFCKAGFAVIGLMASGAAISIESFPVSGTITIHGQPAAVGDDAAFIAEPFDASDGTLGPGAFVVPEHSWSAGTPLGLLTVTYELVQTNTSTAPVAPDTSVSLTEVSMRLDILHAELNGSSLGLGNCSAGPVTLQFVGAVETKGMATHDEQFDIPSFSGCGTYGSMLNLLADSDNAAYLFIGGHFMPTSANVIFIDWFEP